MKTIRTVIMIGCMALGVVSVQAQPSHVWHVVDGGGGKSVSGGVTLRSSIGQHAVQKSTNGNVGQEAGYFPIVRALSNVGSSTTMSLDNSWNLISLPLAAANARKASLFPTAVSNAFAYSPPAGYTERDTLSTGIAYWIKFPSAQSISVTGMPISRDTIPVSAGWNMIGTVSNPALVSGITSDGGIVVLSSAFGFLGGVGYYPEDTLKSGLGYWIKVDRAGGLIVTAISTVAPSAAISIPSRPAIVLPNSTDGVMDKDLSSLAFTDDNGRERLLYLSSGPEGGDLNAYELPPPPPAGLFDVRYGTNRWLESADAGRIKEVPISINGAKYPVVISWEGNTAAALIVNGKALSMNAPGKINIEHRTSNIVLRFAATKSEDIPTEVALLQNYPNPFNPVTTIQYALPAPEYVRISVYNIIGQEVARLIDGIQEAGFKSVSFDVGNLPSGVYTYRMTAGVFAQARKMMLIK